MMVLSLLRVTEGTPSAALLLFLSLAAHHFSRAEAFIVAIFSPIDCL
jgi:hypothetical protein